MRRFIEVSKTGLTSVILHPVRSFVTLCALLAILVPYLTGLALAAGLQRDAQISLDASGDLYVAGTQFGRNVPIPMALISQLHELEGVTEVVPRIVGRVVLGRDLLEAVIVGIPADQFPDSVTCINGRLPAQDGVNEFVIGTELARRLNLRPGSLLPPFYRNSAGERISTIVGVFQSDVSMWQSHLMFSTFETAAEVFDQEGLATDLVVFCQPGYADNVKSVIQRTVSGPDGTPQLRVTSRAELEVFLARGRFHREGIFNLHFVLAFVIGILAILVTSGFGLTERRREIGILKAIGWQTDEVLLRSLTESFLLSLCGASAGILFSFLWLKLFNGFGIAGIFLPGVAPAPSFSVPFRLAPIPALLAFVVAFAITMTGSIWSTWRAASVPPEEAMR